MPRRLYSFFTCACVLINASGALGAGGGVAHQDEEAPEAVQSPMSVGTSQMEQARAGAMHGMECLGRVHEMLLNTADDWPSHKRDTLKEIVDLLKSAENGLSNFVRQESETINELKQETRREGERARRIEEQVSRTEEHTRRIEERTRELEAGGVWDGSETAAGGLVGHFEGLDQILRDFRNHNN